MAAELINDLLGIVALYSTTAVTFELVTLSREGWQAYYTNRLWKGKLHYETVDRLVDAEVIGSSPKTWFRYYLACNRTFWGSLIRVEFRDNQTETRPVPLAEAVIGASLIYQSIEEAEPGVVAISQLADLRIAKGYGGDTRYVAFDRRVRVFTRMFDDDLGLITERGEVFYLGLDEEGLPGIRQIDIPGSGIVGISRGFDYDGDRELFVVLRRDGTVDIYDWLVGSSDPIELITSRRDPRFIQLGRSLTLLGTDGKTYEIDTDLPLGESLFLFGGDERVYYDISHGHGERKVGVVVASTRNLRFLADRSTYESTRPIEGSEGRTQYITQAENTGLIIVD